MSEEVDLKDLPYSVYDDPHVVDDILFPEEVLASTKAKRVCYSEELDAQCKRVQDEARSLVELLRTVCKEWVARRAADDIHRVARDTAYATKPTANVPIHTKVELTSRVWQALSDIHGNKAQYQMGVACIEALSDASQPLKRKAHSLAHAAIDVALAREAHERRLRFASARKVADGVDEGLAEQLQAETAASRARQE